MASETGLLTLDRLLSLGLGRYQCRRDCGRGRQRERDVLHQRERVVNHLVRRVDVPRRERALRAVPDGGGEHRLGLDLQVDGLRGGVVDERHRHGRGHRDLLDAWGEEEERAEHVLVGLVSSKRTLSELI